MSPPSHIQDNADPTGDAVEQRLRSEALRVRRPAPEGLRASVLARLDEAPPAPAARPWRERARGRLAAFAAAAALLVLFLADPFGLRDKGVVSNGNGWTGLDAWADSASMTAQGASVRETLEDPLLREIQDLGQDTTLVAVRLAQDLPGPLGSLFR